MGSIYKLINLKNNRSYVGSARYFPSRKATHLKLLRTNKHYNKHLQASFNKYGEQVFQFEVLESGLDNSVLIAREQYFIDLIKPEYNKRLIAESNLGRRYQMENYHKEKISKAHRALTDEQMSEMQLLRNSGWLLKDLAEKFGVHKASMSRIAKGYMMRHLPKNTNIKPNKLTAIQRVEIYIRTSEGEPNNKLAKEYNVDPSTISRIKNQKRSYTWEFAKS
jgi:group I intron endonuclease